MDEGFRGRGRSGGSDAPVMSRAGSSGGGGGGEGWPLGLQPLHVMTRLAAAAASNRSRELQLFHMLQYSRRNHHHHPQAGVGPEASPFFLSTPSFSSCSSSDLDTESTGSFFPERSTTLGTLIGINHPGPAGRTAHRCEAPNRQPLECNTKHHVRPTERLQACWCAAFTLLLKCASSHCRSDSICQASLSPSLAHLLELERRAAHTQNHHGNMSVLQCESSHHDIALEDRECSHPLANSNTLFDDDGILPPLPSGAPLRGIQLSQLTTSPTDSSYLSTDWSAKIPIVRRTKRFQGQFNTSLCPRFWKIG